MIITSVPKKSIASTVVCYYCACYTFFRNGRYLREEVFIGYENRLVLKISYSLKKIYWKLYYRSICDNPMINIRSQYKNHAKNLCHDEKSQKARNFWCSCHLDRASNVQIGVECQIFVIVIFFNWGRVLQFGAHSRYYKSALTQKG